MAFIQGNSRCNIEITGETVRKTAPDRIYSVRLREQIKKQAQFAEYNKLDFCVAPSVVGEHTQNDIFQAEMQYINGQDFVEFMKGASRDELVRTARYITRIIEQSIAISPETTVPHAILREKINSIAEKGFPALLEQFAKLPTDDLVIPVGVCHGDLTLSNVLFCHGGLALIDFLDCFVETPLQDMAKIRQDTCYQWSLQLYRQPYDPVRTALGMKFLDKKFDELFSKFAFYQRHYPIFQFVNLARILPYCETLDLRVYVENSISELLKSADAAKSNR